MNYALLVFGLAAISFGVYILYDDYKNWAVMKQNNRAQLYKSLVFGTLLIAVGVFVITKSISGHL
jgi:hypothetical protein